MSITSHLAESPSEVATLAACYGLLTPDLLAAHCINCTDADLAFELAAPARLLQAGDALCFHGCRGERAWRRWIDLFKGLRGRAGGIAATGYLREMMDTQQPDAAEPLIGTIGNESELRRP